MAVSALNLALAAWRSYRRAHARAALLAHQAGLTRLRLWRAPLEHCLTGCAVARGKGRALDRWQRCWAWWLCSVACKHSVALYNCDRGSCNLRDMQMSGVACTLESGQVEIHSLCNHRAREMVLHTVGARRCVMCAVHNLESCTIDALHMF